MLADLDLQTLARMDGPERAFLTLYLSGPDAVSGLAYRFATIRALLADEPDELEHFEENLKLAEPLWTDFPQEAEGLCIVVCWANDFVRALPLPVAPADKVWVGSAPYIRPLAERQDEYEDFAVAVIDNGMGLLGLSSGAKFVVTAIVYALQLFPPSGVFLMFLMAPFWSIVTINLGFATTWSLAGRSRRNCWLCWKITS